MDLWRYLIRERKMLGIQKNEFVFSFHYLLIHGQNTAFKLLENYGLESEISFLPSFNMFLLFQENYEIDTVMTNDDVLGDSIPFNQQDAMRQFCYQALKLGIGVGTLTASSCILCLNSFAINISLPSVVILMKFS